jgi:hypothetical protein
VWIPGTDVYVIFFVTSDGYVMPINAVDLLRKID